MTTHDFEHYAESVGYAWGPHAVPCSCGQTAKLVLSFGAAVVSCHECGRFETHRRRYGWETTRPPTGGTSRHTLERMEKIWRRTVSIKGTMGEGIFNLTHRTWFGASCDVDYDISDIEHIFRFHPGNRSVCCLMADEKSGFLCGLLEMFIGHFGWVFHQRITGTRGNIWPSLELMTRNSIGPQEAPTDKQ